MSDNSSQPPKTTRRLSPAFSQPSVSSNQLYRWTEHNKQIRQRLTIYPVVTMPTHTFIHHPEHGLFLSPLCYSSSSTSLVATRTSKLQFPPLYHACVSKYLAVQDICLILLIQYILFLPTKHNYEIFLNMYGLMVILFPSHTYNQIHLIYLLFNLTGFPTRLQ